MKSSQKRLWWLGAATVILLVLYFLMPNEEQIVDHRQTLFSEHYKPMPNIVDPISNVAEQENTNGYQAYEKGQFQNAISLFEKKDPMNFTERLYCGLSYLSLQNGKEAIRILKPLKDQTNPNFRDQVDWYYALSLMQDGQFEKAISNLEEIMQDQNHTFYAKAEDLFNDLH